METYSLLLLLCAVALGLAVPVQELEKGAKTSGMIVNTTGFSRVPNKEFTPNKTILALLHAAKSKLGAPNCYSTGATYGGGGGGSFIDITNYPCEINIQTIRVRFGSIVYGIQIDYIDATGQVYSAPWRGTEKGGGTESIIRVGTREKIIGVYANIGEYDGGTIISHLYFVKKTANGNTVKNGPYGKESYANTLPFIKIGDIKSMYGRSGYYLDAIGFYYENLSC